MLTAAVLTKLSTPLSIIENIKIPVLGKGQVLVKIRYAGICHSQLMEIDGKRGENHYLPHMLAHEGTAVVVDVGDSVSKIKIGDKVVLGWLKGRGLNSPSSVYSSPIGMINTGAVTAFSEYAVVAENRCYQLPMHLSMLEGVLFRCALPTGPGIVENQIRLREENSIGIMGLSGIGLSALLAAVQKAPNSCIAIDTNPNKLLLAQKLGATHRINPNEQDVSEAISEITSGQGLTFCIEAAGSSQTIEVAFSLIAPEHGKCVFATHPAHGEKIMLDPHELTCGKKIEGSWGDCADPEHTLGFYADTELVARQPLLLSEQFSLGDINIAINKLRDKKLVRAIVDMEAI